MTGKCKRCGKEDFIDGDKLCRDCRKRIADMKERASEAWRYLVPVFTLAFSPLYFLAIDTSQLTVVELILEIGGILLFVYFVYLFAVSLLELYAVWSYWKFVLLCVLVAAVIVVKFYTPVDMRVYKPTVEELEQRIEELEEELERAERSADDYEMEYYELEREHEDMLEELEDAWYMSEVEDILDDYS